MTPARRRAIQLLAAGMEVAWLAPWAAFATAASLQRPFPLLAGTAVLLGGYLLTRLQAGRGWLVLAVLLAQVAGLLAGGAAIVHGIYVPERPLLDSAWLAAVLAAPRDPAEWLAFGVSLLWPILFWISGVLLARRPVAPLALVGRLDVGLGAFFVLFFVKFTAASHGVELPDPVSLPFLLSFLLASLLALGLLRLTAEPGRSFLPGFRGLGIFLAFGGAAVLFAALLALFALPYLTVAAEAGLVVLQHAGAAVSPLLLWVLRLLFAPQTLRARPAPAPAGPPVPPPVPPEPGGWLALLDLLFRWAAVVLVGLAALALAGLMLYLLLAFLFSRTARAPRPARAAGPDWRAVWQRLRGLLATLRRPRRAPELYARLLGWARRSGLRARRSETPTEFGRRLAERFPRLREEVGAIVHAFNLEAYAEVRLPAEQLARAGRAWRRLRSPRAWPARARSWWIG